jgi:hypothetical protein
MSRRPQNHCYRRRDRKGSRLGVLARNVEGALEPKGVRLLGPGLGAAAGAYVRLKDADGNSTKPQLDPNLVGKRSTRGGAARAEFGTAAAVFLWRAFDPILPGCDEKPKLSGVLSAAAKGCRRAKFSTLLLVPTVLI